METLRYIAESDVHRLDAFLADKVNGLSKNEARSLCENGQVRVNGVLGKSGDSLHIGDVVEIEDYRGKVYACAQPRDTLPPDFAVLYEDADILVVAKPRKMASVRLRHEDALTLADCMVSYCAQCLQASPDPREAGLVQRLDYYTSGVVIAGKSPQAWQAIRKQLFAERVEKTYLALVEKRPIKKRFSANFPLTQSKDGKSMLANREKGGSESREPVQLAAITEITVVGQYELGARWFSVIRAKGRRMRRHQVRVHLAASGHPLVGDTLYGAETLLNDALPWAHEEEEGFLLHAQDLSLQHPVSGKEMRFQCSSDYFRKLSKVF